MFIWSAINVILYCFDFITFDMASISEKILACDIDLLLFNSLVNPANVFRWVYCIF